MLEAVAGVFAMFLILAVIGGMLPATILLWREALRKE